MLKKITTILVIFILLLIAGYYLYNNIGKTEIKIVKITGNAAYSSILKSSIYWSTKSNRNNISALPLSDGNLLYITGENNEFFYRYNIEDGDSINFNLKDFVLYKNEKPVSIIVELKIL